MHRTHPRASGRRRGAVGAEGEAVSLPKRYALSVEVKLIDIAESVRPARRTDSSPTDDPMKMRWVFDEWRAWPRRSRIRT